MKWEDGNWYPVIDFHVHPKVPLEELISDMDEAGVSHAVILATETDPEDVMRPETEKWIRDTYRREEADDLLHTEITEGVLTVTVDKCPAVEYMRKLGIEPSKYFIEETRTVYATVAEECGYGFTLEYYREDGAARFEFNA